MIKINFIWTLSFINLKNNFYSLIEQLIINGFDIIFFLNLEKLYSNFLLSKILKKYISRNKNYFLYFFFTNTFKIYCISKTDIINSLFTISSFSYFRYHIIYKIYNYLNIFMITKNDFHFDNNLNSIIDYSNKISCNYYDNFFYLKNIDLLYNNSLFFVINKIINISKFIPSIKYLDFLLNSIKYFNINNQVFINNYFCYSIYYCYFYYINNTNVLSKKLSKFLNINLLFLTSIEIILFIIIKEYGLFSNLYNNINIDHLIIRSSLYNECFISLSKNKYYLSNDIIVVSDNSNILSLAGIINHKKYQIKNNTTNILLEIGFFNYLKIQDVQLNFFIKDIMFIYVKYNYFFIINNYFYFIINSIKKYLGGYIYKIVGCNKFYISNFFATFFLLNDFFKFYGFIISKNIFCCFIKKQGFDLLYNYYIKISLYYSYVLSDIIYMFSFLVNFSLYYTSIIIYSINNFFNNIKKIFFNHSFIQLFSSSFSNLNYLQFFNLRIPILIYNPIKIYYNCMRNTLLFNMLYNVKYNFLLYNCFFEIGKIYYIYNKFIEENSIVLLKFFNNNLSFIKYLFFRILQELNIQYHLFTFQSYKNFIYSYNSLIIYQNYTIVGFIGFLSKKALSIFNLHEDVLCLELYIDRLYKKFNITKNKKTNFVYSRNFSFYINSYFSLNNVINSIKKLNLFIYNNVSIIDIYIIPEIYIRSFTFSVIIKNNFITTNKYNLLFISNYIIFLLHSKFNVILRDVNYSP